MKAPISSQQGSEARVNPGYGVAEEGQTSLTLAGTQDRGQNSRKASWRSQGGDLAS